MDIKYLNRLLSDDILVSEKIKQYLEEKSLKKFSVDKEEIKGHLMKADHNLKFVSDNLGLGYFDWCLTGCYYAVYHAALALIILKGYYSKNHDATLCILIKEYYKNGVSAEEVELLNKFFLDYQEIIFYVQSKEKREDASYSSSIKFDKQLVQELRIKAALFVDKAKQIIVNM
ncbi:HEPN domain-containing protein [Candidatus Woesearchaeota archaeon]|nr:HEPN domain-containing protein [Candidatus Woesearchaeota archaeon]